MAHRMRIRRDDQVVVISGKDKGKTGKILRVDTEKQRVFVEGLNIIKRHQRPSALNPNAVAGVIEREGPIHVSNVALLDPKENKPTRIGTVVTSDGKRARVAKRSGTQID
jgi:large subunit ribosomal protein L24